MTFQIRKIARPLERTTPNEGHHLLLAKNSPFIATFVESNELFDENSWHGIRTSSSTLKKRDNPAKQSSGFFAEFAAPPPYTSGISVARNGDGE